MKRFGLLVALAFVVGCDEEATYRARAQQQRWAEEDQEKRLVKKCGEKPDDKALARKDWEVTLRVIGTEVTFPHRQRFEPINDTVKTIPEFVYQTVVNHGGGGQTTHFSERRPHQSSDGMYELHDLKTGEKQIVGSSVTISLARIEEAAIDPVSADLRNQALEFVKRVEAWNKCAGYEPAEYERNSW